MTISWCLGVKLAAAKFDLISSLDGKSASDGTRTWDINEIKADVDQRLRHDREERR